MTPNIRLACCSNRAGIALAGKEWRVCGVTMLPSLLLSYAYRNIWEQYLDMIHYRTFVLDSGAFTVNSKGLTITVEEYRDAVLAYRDRKLRMVEVFSLDVIGDWKGTEANTEYLWKHGIRAIPAFHYGEPEDVLIRYAKNYPKIALGGAVGIPNKEKQRWVRQCFARVWPKPIHGFGFGRWAVDEFPFHSVDCSDWEGSAARFGSWESFGRLNIGLKKKDVEQNLHIEVQHWLEHEYRAKQKWKRIFDGVKFDEHVGLPFLEDVA